MPRTESLNTYIFFLPNIVRLALLLFSTLTLNAQQVVTQHNDLKRTGWNAAEIHLTQANVSGGSFGKIFTRAVDDQIYCQPLIMNQVSIGGGIHNIVIIATVNNSMYAFDAEDSATMNPYWHTNLTYNPGGTNAYRPIKNSDMTGACSGYYNDFSGNMGIVGTPVIDSLSGTIYVVSRSVTRVAPFTFVQYLHALDLITGADKIPPVYITAVVNGTGDGSNGTTLIFNQQTANQRPALLLYQGVVYIAWSSHCDWGPYHGWLIGYDAATLTQKYVYNDCPDGGLAGIWMSGQAPAVDDDGFIYVTTGNGTVGTAGNPNDTTNRGESLLKLSTASGKLKVVDFFTPGDYDYLNQYDLDYGVDGVLLIPNTHLSLSGSKESYLYLIDDTHMGGMVPGNTNALQLLDVNAQYNGDKHIHGSPVYYQDDKGNEFVYAWAEDGLLKQFPFQRSAMIFDTLNKITGNTVLPQGMPGAMLSVSSNGTTAATGVLWASHPLTGDANQNVVPGILQAFDATDVSRELWNSNANGIRDAVGKFAKFVPPTIANGRVYLATFSDSLLVYGVHAPVMNTCPNPLPAPWSSSDIGYVYIPGNVCYNGGTYTITASGDDIWNTADAFHSMFQPVTGNNLDIMARVASISNNTDAWAKCGVMIRASLDPGSPHVFMAITPGNIAAFQDRRFLNDLSYNTSQDGIQAPYWVRLTGNGNFYTGYISSDGINWTIMDTVTLSLGIHPYVGLAYTAHNNTTYGTATVDHLALIYNQDTLSIQLSDFTGKNVNNQYAQLNWTTTKELDFDHFVMERSTPATDFDSIGNIPGKGDSQVSQNYAFQDAHPVEGANYYRLKMVDQQGHFIYSNMVLLNFSLAVIKLYPNPAKHIVYLENNPNFTNDLPIQIDLIDPLGQKLFSAEYPTAGLTRVTVQIPPGMVTGTCFLVAVNSTGKKQAWKIQIRK